MIQMYQYLARNKSQEASSIVFFQDS
jgi:hypothetical protein